MIKTILKRFVKYTIILIVALCLLPLVLIFKIGMLFVFKNEDEEWQDELRKINREEKGKHDYSELESFLNKDSWISKMFKWALNDILFYDTIKK